MVRNLTRLAPGAAIVAGLTAAAFALGRAVPFASPLLWGMALGLLAAPVVRARESAAPGIRFAARCLLRVGVALLGLRVSIGQVADIGVEGLLLAVGTIAVTLTATISLGRRLG